MSGPIDIITDYTSKWKLKVDEISKKAEETAGNVWQHRKRVFPYLSIVHIFFYQHRNGFICIFTFVHLATIFMYFLLMEHFIAGSVVELPTYSL